MQTRELGKSGLEVPVLTFGAWALGGWAWGGASAEKDAKGVEALRASVEAGMTAIDTAPIYGFGHSEEVVGRALREAGDGLRERAQILTKVGFRWDDPRGELAFEGTGPDGEPVAIRMNSRPDSVRLEVENSLRRLGTDCVELVQVHRRDPTTPVADTMGALLELRAEGKLRHIGVSNYTPEDMAEAQRALGEVPLASDQPRYSLVKREIEADVLPWAREHSVGLLVYSPLEQGLLTGKVTAERTFPETDGRHRRDTFQPENRARVNALVDEVLRPVAEAHGATPGQVALAWTIAQPGVTSAIVGARDPAQVDENVGAARLSLTAAELQRIDRAFAGLELTS